MGVTGLGAAFSLTNQLRKLDRLQGIPGLESGSGYCSRVALACNSLKPDFGLWSEMEVGLRQ